MKNMRRGAAIAAAAAALISLVACSTGVRGSSATTAAPTPAQHASTPPAAEPAAAPTPPPSPISSACVGTPAGVKHIYVSIDQQHLWACTGEVLLTETAVTTGASALTNVHDATPSGTFRVTNKVRNTVLAGHDVNGAWHDDVAYWMPFSGGDGFHDAPWQTFPLGSPLYKTQGSHGCVHIPVEVIAALFDWAPIGTLVTVRS